MRSAKNSEVKMLNLKTGEMTCTEKLCKGKWTEQIKEERSITPKWAEGRTITWMESFHRCTECGRKVKAGNDKMESFWAYESAAIQGGRIIEEETTDVR
jgi:hypothetical protein